MVSSERIQVTLSGGAPWGFRLSGGGGLPLIINKIRKKSQAHVRGLKEGDAVISINGVHVHDKTQDEALELVEAAGDSLTLEIFRGDDQSGDKPRKTIQVQSSGGSQSGTLRLLTTGDDGVSPGEVVLIPSGDTVTSGNTVGLKTRFIGQASSGVQIPVIRTTSVERTIPVKDLTSSATRSTVLNKSPVISFAGRTQDAHVATSLPAVAAKPFYVSQAGSSTPPNQPPQTQAPSGVSTSSQQGVIAPSGQVYAPQPPQSSVPHPPPLSTQPPPVSPKPQSMLISQPQPISVKPSGVTSSVSSTIFDDGQTHQEVTREKRFQQSDDGRSTTVVERETTTTKTGRPSFVKGQTSAFNAIKPQETYQPSQKSFKSTTTTVKSTTSIVNQKGPTPFISSPPSNILQPQFQTPTFATSHSSDSQFPSTQSPLFKPTKFVPGTGKRDAPGLFTPTSPLPDSNIYVGFKDGKENVSPQPMFQVKKIVSETTSSSARDVWRPNMWLPGQQPSNAQEQSKVGVTREESFPSSQPRPGYSLVEEQKRKLMALQTPKNESVDVYGHENQDNEDSHGHHKHERLHIFAPPVEIHADQDSPYEEHHYMDEYEDGMSSPDSTGGRRKKKLYGDSAFYDAPGKSYPTITEQMKLCKKIAQSLTSAANRRARGAKMFMKRKRKSSKWIHEGHSEISSSAGDVANIHELDSELHPDEGGNKPMLTFKIPSVKNRVADDSKQTKMALTQEQFEKLRLSAKKCDHRTLPPDPCFDIVADLKAHKGRGGRLFERRKQRSDKFVIDETNAKFALPRSRADNSPQPSGHHLSPYEVALKHGWKGEPPTSQNVETPLVPVVKSSLKSEESPCLLKGKNFNRIAKGWSGGGEYPVAENLRHISPTRELGQTQPATSLTEQQSYNKFKAWQPTDTPQPSVQGRFQDWSRDQQQARQQDYQQPVRQQQDYQQPVRQQHYQQPSRHDEVSGSGWAEQRQSGFQAPRPKSWHPGSYESQNFQNGSNNLYSTTDYRHGSAGYPSVAYKQPIIPGTDL